MTVDDSVVQKLWKLTNELTAQLVFNRNATLELKQQLADLQAKTAQGSGPVAQDVALFGNKEHADLSLRIANERLMEENSQLQEQLREYERWMEYIMTKFRLQNFAMAQSRKEAMHEAYRMAEQEGDVAMHLQEENAMLQARLADVGAVARKVINEEYYTTETLIETLELENQGLREMLGVAADNLDPMATRQLGNRVSFPSTGSYMASSGSDGELQAVPVPAAPPSPPELAVKAASSPSTVTPPSPATHAPKPASQATSPGAAGSSVSSTASDSVVTSPVLKSTKKKPGEALPVATGAKGGMTINTSALPKRTNSIASNNNNNNNTGGSSIAPKPKKTQRKQKS